MAPRTLAAIGLCACLLGCDDDGIRSYRAPKQAVRAAEPARAVAWDVPPGWAEAKSEQAMRIATFKPAAGGPEIVVSAFPGESGGLLANINRWRDQLKLPHIDEAALATAVQTTEDKGVRVSLADITGNTGEEMLGAVITPGDGQTWFVKTVGEPAQIAGLKGPFTAFAKSFRLSAAAPAPAAPAIAPAPAGGPVHERLTAFAPPATWKRDANASSIVAAAFDATNADGSAKITATMLMNDGGGVVANINRWRDQLGLAPVAALTEQPVTDLSQGNLIVDLTSADGSRRLMAAIVASQGQTWFFKMTGPPNAVEAEKAAYTAMVRGVGLGERTP